MSTPEDLLAAGDFTALWSKALPLVKWQLGRMVQSGQLQSQYLTDDLIQQCSLAVGKALRRWDPAKGAFSTFMVQSIRSAAADNIRRETYGIDGGREAQWWGKRGDRWRGARAHGARPVSGTATRTPVATRLSIAAATRV